MERPLEEWSIRSLGADHIVERETENRLVAVLAIDRSFMVNGVLWFLAA